MKQGAKGGYMAGCCSGFEIWGIACDAPNIQRAFEAGFSYQTSYDLTRQGKLNGGSGSIVKTVVPELWERDEFRTWSLHLCQVAGTYPGNGCDPTRAATSHADDSFSVSLGAVAQHYHDDDPLTDEYRKLKYCFGTRAIYVDGAQEYIAVRTSGSWPDGNVEGSTTGEPGINMWWGDHQLVRIASQELVASYKVQTLDGHKTGSGANGGDAVHTTMEGIFSEGAWASLANMFPPLTGAYGLSQPACNQISLGIEYCVWSSYSPATASTGWSVGRLKYEGDRYNPSTDTFEDGIEVFQSLDHYFPDGITDIGFPDIGLPETEYAGNYMVVLPSVRVYIDSTAVAPDECWVCALRKPGAGATKIVTGRWLSRVFREEGSDEEDTEENSYADGTIEDSEIENVILDADDSGDQAVVDFPEETWENPIVRAYIHMRDPTTGSNKDLMLFTTSVDSPTVEAEDVVSDFEQPGSYEPTFLDSGLEDTGLHWTTGGQKPTDGWISDPTNPISGTYSARTQFEDVTIIDDVVLKITFNAMEAGTVTLDYRFDNRWYGTRIPPFVELTNFPDPDNYLDVRLDGSLLSGSAFKISGVDQPTSRIDNATVPGAGDEESDYTTAREITIQVTAGTHTLSFTIHRQYQDNGHMYAQIDNVAFGMPVMVGEDPDGGKRWFYNGERVQEFNWWAWARRDEESANDISTRVKTVPDYITMDGSGRILIGNPHYVVRLKRREDEPTLFELDTSHGSGRGDGYDDSDDEQSRGYVRFTASPASEVDVLPPCSDPDLRLTVPDAIADPPWGSFQILPVGEDNYQVRGANAALRDATEYPIRALDHTYKHPLTGVVTAEMFKELTRVMATGIWSQRAHSWTISNDGQTLRPHVEIIWRPMRDMPAHPESVWPHEPYRSNFATSDGTDPFAPDSVRPRNPLFLPLNSTRPRWAQINFIVTNTFSDTFTQFPQAVWISRNDDPPSDPEDPAYWDPDDDLGPGPWQSAIWYAIQSRFCPTGIFHTSYQMDDPEIVCPDEEEEEVTAQTFRVHFHNAGNVFYGFTDFDAVDCDCDCCG